MWRKGNPCLLLVGMYGGAATVENSMGSPQKTKNRTTIWSSSSTSVCTSEGNEATTMKGYLRPHVRCGIIHKDMETT